ncbi:hypothetical protein FACS1894105_03430 [Clostridia bacterium]|nr:hypothetical protein FACS1894105_03430 [Clostridia bacterium]
MHHIKLVEINDKINYVEKKVVAGHEVAHFIILVCLYKNKSVAKLGDIVYQRENKRSQKQLFCNLYNISYRRPKEVLHMDKQ